MESRHAKCRALVRKYYADVPTREALLDEAVSQFACAGDFLLDAGCGDELPLLKQYGPKVAFAVGLDALRPSTSPPRGSAVVLGDLSLLPFLDQTFDIIVSRSVIEHLADPPFAFRELLRILKPGGWFIFTTPNKYYYSSLIARSMPFSWKHRYLRWVFGERGYDHFPVFYRANTRRSLRRIAAAAGLRVESVRAIRHFPYYLLFSPILFRLGMLYDWTVTRLGLDDLQSNWLIVLQRPPALAATDLPGEPDA